jgi:hypothetical protein
MTTLKYLTKEESKHIDKSILSVVMDKPIRERIRILEEEADVILREYVTYEEYERYLEEKLK